MKMKQTPYVDVLYEEQVVIIRMIDDNKMDVLVIDYDMFSDLAYQIRQSPFGK